MPTTPRHAYFIPVDSYVDGKGFIPGLVVEGEPGYRLMSGNGAHAAPWYWGPSYEAATATARRVNAYSFGLDDKAVAEIICSSMAAGR